MLEQLTYAKRIFWSYLPSNSSFIASFIYRNHAGPYLNLMVALAAGLAFWHHERSQLRPGKTGPSVILAFLTAFVATMVIFSYSRGSIAVLLAFSLVVAGALTVR
jgi:FtsH-binding integral membrane protein